MWYNRHMESVIRNVRDIDSRERQALEQVLGQHLKENQKIIIQVVTLPSDSIQNEKPEPESSTQLPDWCDVFAGLNDEQVAEVEDGMRRARGVLTPSSSSNVHSA
jgi:hypothetical protein